MKQTFFLNTSLFSCWKAGFLPLLVLISLLTSGSQAEPLNAQAPHEATQPSPPSVSLPLAVSAGEPGELTDKPSKNKRKMVKKELKKELREDIELQPALREVLKLKWEPSALQSASSDTKKIGLEKLFSETLQNNLSVRQAEVQIKDAEAQAKEIRDPGLFYLLNPVDTPSLKKAAESTVQAAKANLKAARQKALLESAKMYGQLTQTFLGKYLAYQAIEQGRNQLKVEQERFIAGETNRFDLTQTQMVLLERFGNYLNADNTYHAASIALANQIGVSGENTWIPEGVELQDQQATVPLLSLIPLELTREQVLRASKIRPDLEVLGHQSKALHHLVKASSGAERLKKQADLHQMELESVKLSNAITVMAEKAYTEYKLAQQRLVLAQQRYDMAARFVHQLQVSYNAGFSSAKELLDGHIEMARSKTALIGAQVSYNLSQIQLLYEMGLLEEGALARTLVIPPNTL